jgi:hypothetical protein
VSPASPRHAARTYLDRRLMTVPVPYKHKAPVLKGWQDLRLTEETIPNYFQDRPQNLGLLTGKPSGSIVDVDVDAEEAQGIADRFLPETGLVSGRVSAPESHWFYHADPLIPTRKFRDPTKPKSDQRAMLVELRSTGCQTLVWPSVHPSGEPIQWAKDGDPALISGQKLETTVARLAAATLLARSWRVVGGRHDTALALSGALLRHGWSVDEVESFIEAIVIAAGDEEREDRLRAVASTAETLTAGEPVTGWPTVATLVGDGVVDAVRRWLNLGGRAGEDEGPAATGTGGKGKGRAPSQSSLLVDLVRSDGVELFHDAAGDPFISFPREGHLETWPLRAKMVRSHLARLTYQQQGTTPNAQALQDALQVLEGEACFAGPERPVAVRLADHDGARYLDLGDAAWQVIVIEPGHWSIHTAGEVPVRFRRPRGLLPLPEPRRAGSLAPLRPLLNVQEETDVVLLVGWLLGCLAPSGPQAILQLLGEQGSAKSSVARLLRSLVDPNTVPLRTQPKNEGDLLIAAGNGLVVTLDNLSKIPDWLSDALCRLATGGGLSKRELYTDTDEVLLDARRPILLTAISEAATASDLLDRCLTVTLAPIPAEQRRTEAELDHLVVTARPLVLGALLDAAAAALAVLPTIQLHRKPRLADFATWVEAAAPALGWEPGVFLDAMEVNRRTADAVAVEALPVGPVLLSFMTHRDRWEGTATALLNELNALVTETVRKEREWPKSANRLSNQLRRLGPNLRRLGISLEGDRESGSGQRLLRLTKNAAVWNRHHRHDRHTTSEQEAKDEDGSSPQSSQDRHTTDGEGQQPREDASSCDGCDDGDDPLPSSSTSGGAWTHRRAQEDPPHPCHACGRTAFHADGICATCHPRPWHEREAA